MNRRDLKRGRGRDTEENEENGKRQKEQCNEKG